MYYKLSDYASKFNVTYRTAWNRYKKGKIVDAFVDNTNHICIPIKTIDVVNRKVVIYSRVSSNDAKDNLIRQEERLLNYATSNNFNVIKSYKEVGSGMNDNRKSLTNLLLSNNDWDILLIENKDRLTRFGFNYIENLLKTLDKSIIVVNKVNNEPKNDLINDLVSIIYSFSARIYGLRKAKNKQTEITKILETV